MCNVFLPSFFPLLKARSQFLGKEKILKQTILLRTGNSEGTKLKKHDEAAMTMFCSIKRHKQVQQVKFWSKSSLDINIYTFSSGGTWIPISIQRFNLTCYISRRSIILQTEDLIKLCLDEGFNFQLSRRMLNIFFIWSCAVSVSFSNNCKKLEIANVFQSMGSQKHAE